ncbi:MAG: hypothetical protein WD066_19665 [Planctomycetaceae bacterium]
MLKTTLVAPCAGLLAAALLLAGTTDASAARPRKVITKPQFDPDAQQVDLFEADQSGQIEVKVIPKDATGGNVLIENKTDQPLSVQIPETFVGVHVYKQFGPGIGPGGGFGAGGVGLTGTGTALGAQGMAQPLGGMMGGMGMGGMGMGMMPGMMGGMGMYSIPPESVARIPYRSVCLAHGKPDPTPRMTYRMVPVESFSEDPALPQLLALLGDPKVDQHAVQAATWHLTDGMTWQQLANKRIERLGGVPSQPYFSLAHLRYAQQTLAVAQQRAAEAEKAKDQAGRPTRSQPADREETPAVRQPLSATSR